MRDCFSACLHLGISGAVRSASRQRRHRGKMPNPAERLNAQQATHKVPLAPPYGMQNSKWNACWADHAVVTAGSSAAYPAVGFTPFALMVYELASCTAICVRGRDSNFLGLVAASRTQGPTFFCASLAGVSECRVSICLPKVDCLPLRPPSTKRVSE